jgi:hypothetical protein
MTTPSNTPDSSALGAAWVDNLSLSSLVEALRLNPQESVQGRINADQRFWSTPARSADSPLQEAMQVTLSSARRINYLTFEFSNFPADITLEYFDESLRTWVPVLSGDGTRNSPAQESVLDSKPNVIPAVNSVTGKIHPQHSFSGHWKSLEFATRPFIAKEVRVVLQRSTRGAPPTTVNGQPVDYSLAIRNFYVGYRVNSLGDIPKTEPLNSNRREYAPFASASDVLGSTLQYSLRVNRASNLLDNSDEAIWKSEPQPVPWAVVDLYVDTRDLDNQPQLVDRFLLDPLHDGVRFNLYWSEEEPTGTFSPTEDPLGFPIISTFDEANIGTDVLHAGPANLDKIGYVDINNGPFGFDPGRPWWIGGLLYFKFEHGSQSVATPIVDFGEFLVAMTPFGPRITTAHGDSLLVRTDLMSIGTPFHFVAAYDGTHLSLFVRQGAIDYVATMTATVPLGRQQMASSMRFGGFQGTTPGVANFDLVALVVKVDEVADGEIAADFMRDYSDFIEGGQKQNAILRYHDSFSTSNYREGFIGGPPDRFGSLPWTPVARDFVLRKGYLEVPPTRARYWKFEFCGLVPQTYEVFRPIQRVVKTFTPEMWIPRPDPATMQASIRQLFPGVLTSISGGVTSGYRDSSVVTMGSGIPTKGYTPTTARVIRSNEVRGAISRQYFVWGYLPLHSGGRIPSFAGRAIHLYDAVTVDHVNKIGYFVGLRSIKPSRLDYLATDDTPEYVETFADSTNISAEGNWILAEGHINTGSAHYAEAKSVPLLSSRVVRAIQFATQQSDARQILPDDDFTDPDHAAWTEVGDATLASELTTHQALGTMLRVDRSPQPGTWGSIELAASTWGALDSTTYGALENPTVVVSTIGGITSDPVSVPFGGQVHVAARVVAPADLTEPLHVQIVDNATERVLADAQIDVQANKVTEWYASYAINDLRTPAVWKWGDFEAVQMGPTLNDNFNRPNASSLGTMQSGQRWKTGADGSLVVSSNMAITSVEGRSNSIDSLAPWGALEIVFGNVGTGSSGKVKSFEFEPLAMLTDGTIAYSGGTTLSTASVLTTNNTARAIQDSDAIQVEILPSRYVPVGKEDIDFTRDDVLRPYSCMVYLNGVWVRTLSHEHGARTIRSLQGRLNQQIDTFKWTPKNYGRLLAPVITRYPRQGYGAFVDAENKKFIDGEGFVWNAEGAWDVTTATEVSNDVTVGAPLTAASNGAIFIMDTQYWYGSMSSYVRNVASTFGSGAKHGMVFCLDYDAGIFINYAGNVVGRDGTNYGSFFPAGIEDNNRYTIQWAKTALVGPATRGVIDPNVHPDMLIGRKNGGSEVTFVHAAMATWKGTRRGLAGDYYDPAAGSRPVAANYTLDTSFRSFNWAPDAYHTPAPTGPTWGNVTKEETATYSSAILGREPDLPELSARIVQYGITNDLWFVDTLSMFIDPIMWHFSNDGGYSFYPALNIRNNPNGVLLFPVSTEVIDPAQMPGTALVWKVMAYAPESNVSHLVIRPWYGGALSAITHQVGMGGGPNVMPYDQYTDLRRDARFQVWNKPIPQSWWYEYRTIRPPLPDLPQLGPDLYLSPEIIESGSES